MLRLKGVMGDSGTSPLRDHVSSWACLVCGEEYHGRSATAALGGLYAFGFCPKCQVTRHLGPRRG